jgi:hypothetical protein
MYLVMKERSSCDLHKVTLKGNLDVQNKPSYSGKPSSMTKKTSSIMKGGENLLHVCMRNDGRSTLQ